MGIPQDSPLRLAYSPFWHNFRTNDEGIPRPNGFHTMVNEGKIKVVAPARMTGYGGDGRSVLLNNGQTIEADLVILATGYRSSWNDIFSGFYLFRPRLVAELILLSEETAEALGLYRHRPTNPRMVDEWTNYTTLANPPAVHPDSQNWSSSVYKGIVPTNNIERRDFAINGAVVMQSS